jgi:NAD-dependent deacetylase
MKTIVVFSGAGISAESGIQTFRDSDGLWENYSIEEIATPQAWKSNPNLVTEFYNKRRKQILEAQPNQAHRIIAELEEKYKVLVITQNIDDLHERAGSSSVLHLHGNITYAKSSGPQKEEYYYKINGWKLTPNDTCPDGYRLRPHVVWFGEEVPAYQDAIEQLEQADILIVVGTSLNVHPAAGLIHFARNATKAFVIDPKAERLNIPKTFVQITSNAETGFVELKRQLTEN